MRLQNFRIQNFRCFIDSGEVDLADPLVPVVGRNESGKSALLYALSRLTADDPFDHLLDWPAALGRSQYAATKPVVGLLRFDGQFA